MFVGISGPVLFLIFVFFLNQFGLVYPGFYGVLDLRKKIKTRFSCVMLGLKTSKTLCSVRCLGIFFWTVNFEMAKRIIKSSKQQK